jgi:hypothetical protein
VGAHPFADGTQLRRLQCGIGVQRREGLIRIEVRVSDDCRAPIFAPNSVSSSTGSDRTLWVDLTRATPSGECPFLPLCCPSVQRLVHHYCCGTIPQKKVVLAERFLRSKARLPKPSWPRRRDFKRAFRQRAPLSDCSGSRLCRLLRRRGNNRGGRPEPLLQLPGRATLPAAPLA